MIKVTLLLAAFGLVTAAVKAETVIATHTIRAQQVITNGDVTTIPETLVGMARKIEDVSGQEAKQIIYAGRPIALNSIGPPALIDRNQIVPLSFRKSGLVIRTDGRSLGRGGYGDLIRVINLGSRKTVTGMVGADGTVWVNR